MRLNSYKLGDCLTMIENGATIKQKESAGGYPITRIETLSNDRFNRDRLGYADVYDIDNYADHILDDEDLIMSHINSRPFLGRTVIYLKKDNEAIIHGMNVLRIKTKRELLNPFYAYYYFKTPHFRKAIDNIRTDAINQSSINTNNIKDITIYIPSISDQESVVATLRDIDKKIELNENMNAELEAMAKQLYDYWFLQFDFPDENCKPYKSSGGKMVWNEKLKREIPEGWEVKDINFFASTPKDSVNPFEYPEKLYKHYSIPAYDECGTYLSEMGVSIQSNKFIVHEGQILVPKLNPWYNRVLYIDNDVDSICSTEFVILDAYEDSVKGYLYFIVKSDSFISYCTKSSTGTSHSQRRVNPDILKGFNVPYNKSVVDLYSAIVMPFILKMHKNTDQKKELVAIRDSLLPMLMNGQVTIE